MRSSSCISFLLWSSTPALSLFLGPTYPYPADLSSNSSLVQQAWEDLSSTFAAFFVQGKNSSTLSGAEGVTFSTSLFSLHDPDATQLQYHFTAPQIAHSKIGTTKVDQNSIYRVASVTKLITVFAGLLELSIEDWNRPLTDILPGLAAVESDKYSPEWDQITPWSLAQQISGIQQTGIIGDLLITYASLAAYDNTTVTKLELLSGLPPTDPTVLGYCALLECPAKQFVAKSAGPTPGFQPFFTPGYSDLGLMLLGLCISRLTGKAYPALYSDAVFQPLNMTSSFVNAPTTPSLLKQSVIAGPLNGSWVFPTNNPSIPSGGILSTISDLNKLGLGILNSTLLSPVKTRQWMKPHSHTASFSYSVGAPWEIVRYVHPSTGKITDIYTKLGDSGAYGGMLAIIPDYNAGFSFLNALYQPSTVKQTRGTSALKIINEIATTIIPALEAQAAKEATRNFVGTYKSDSNSSVTSSLTISFNESTVATSNLGLSISSWVSNGTNVLENIFSGVKPQLLLSIPRQDNEVTFQLATYPQWTSYSAAGMTPFGGFYDSNFDWIKYDGIRYDERAVNTFRFTVDEDGNAVKVYNPATEIGLKRTST